MEKNVREAKSLKQQQYRAVVDILHHEACLCVHTKLCNIIQFCLPPLDIPLCASDVQATNILASNLCSVSLTWQHPPNSPPFTSTTVTYCPTSSPNCGNSMTCTSPCTISGLDNGTEYQFTVIPNNNCGSPTGCTGNMSTVMTRGEQCTCLHRRCPSICTDILYVCNDQEYHT